MAKRIMKDLENVQALKEHGIYVVPDDADMRHVYALILGPEDSAYEGGLFFFDIRFPEDYPFQSPRVTFMTCDGRTRFHPNLYVEGKVCLSILGTWSGPSWTTTMTLSTVLLSIQTLLDNDPLRHEPGWERDGAGYDEKRKAYRDWVEWRTLVYAAGIRVRGKAAVSWMDELLEEAGEWWKRGEAKLGRLLAAGAGAGKREMYGLTYGMAGTIDWDACAGLMDKKKE